MLPDDILLHVPMSPGQCPSFELFTFLLGVTKFSKFMSAHIFAVCPVSMAA